MPKRISNLETIKDAIVECRVLTMYQKAIVLHGFEDMLSKKKDACVVTLPASSRTYSTDHEVIIYLVSEWQLKVIIPGLKVEVLYEGVKFELPK